MRCSGRDVPFEVVTSVLYIVDSSPTDRVSFADFVATIRVALCVMPMLGAQIDALHLLHFAACSILDADAKNVRRICRTRGNCLPRLRVRFNVWDEHEVRTRPTAPSIFHWKELSVT